MPVQALSNVATTEKELFQGRTTIVQVGYFSLIRC